MTTKNTAAPAPKAVTPASKGTTSAHNDVEDGTGVIKLDPWLSPYKSALQERYAGFQKWKHTIEEAGGYDKFSRGYESFGFHVSDKGITYREWAPNATGAYLYGDFNKWDRLSHPMQRDRYGVYSITLPNNPDGSPAIKHNTKVKITMIKPDGTRIDRLPVWIHRVTQDLDVSPVYDAVFWNPPKKYQWKNKAPPKPASLKVYEAHVGIATAEPRVGQFTEFTANVLPRIKKLGYNTIQLMAIMEHAYYASFGYQITSFFAASSRYGTPEELKELIDAAHGLGITVLLDVVHSHACKNVLDGLNEFDGSDHQYFHEGAKGRHELWDSRLFNYGSYEVMRFLLSNLRFYIEEYGFDGYRFDGVTSMMYTHHGIGFGFSGNYHEYFGDGVDSEAVTYLMVANDMLHQLYPNCITIAEDVSGMPTLCRPVSEGGIGFDYRLSMAIPDMWIKLLKEKSDSEWDIGNIVYTLTNRRHMEPSIAYCESHDQALVGDKTIAFWLMDKEMYTHMSVMTELTPIIDRGLALHKMIRLVTHALGGEGYLTFIGNEFGHPEWLDFPRAGNDSSFHYARRQWNVVDDPLLRYKFLNDFDGAMNLAEDKVGWLAAPQAFISLKHEGDKVLAFDRAGAVFIFNFHGSQSFTEYRIAVPSAGQYKILLNSDEERFGGHGRVSADSKYFSSPEPWGGHQQYIQVYIPSRTALVLVKV
ncbi:alpha-1,4-glucan branching enzyme [Mortierella sp. AD032]|nr:alpha-1,4-glucan branching enzyme [Mortierella sp. AD032]